MAGGLEVAEQVRLKSDLDLMYWGGLRGVMVIFSGPSVEHTDRIRVKGASNHFIICSVLNEKYSHLCDFLLIFFYFCPISTKMLLFYDKNY